MFDSPWMILLSGGAALFLLKMWLDDYRAQQQGVVKPGAIPGATPAPMKILLVAALGSLLLVGIESLGEVALGTADEQQTVAWLVLIAWMGAGILEEVVFRGFLVVTNRGRAALVASIVGFSLLFSLLHVQYYLEWAEEAAWHEFTWALDVGSGWTLLILFVNSMWWYWLRFNAWNPQRSLLPCFVGHVASNLGVFLVKLSQGYVDGLY